MELLLAILVWLGLLMPAQQITSSQYDEIINTNSQAICAVIDDSATAQQALYQYSTKPAAIVIDPLTR
jgi:hypothetical protein